MADYNTPNGADTAGIAGSAITTFDNFVSLITGDRPGVVTTDELVAASQTIPALTPVKFTAGAIVPAASGDTEIGITVAAIVTGAGDTTVRAAVYRAGVFNPDAIAWPASYDTAEKKRLAFEGAPSPTQIIIRKPAAFTPPAP